jgi:hypothetical protein
VGSPGNFRCEVTANENPGGIDIFHGWNKQLKIDAAKNIECSNYFDAQGNSSPEITMGSISSYLQVDANADDTSTFSGGAYIDGSHGGVYFQDVGNKWSTVNLGSTGYSDSDMVFGASQSDWSTWNSSGAVPSHPAVATNITSTGPWTVGKDWNVYFTNFGWMTIKGGPNATTIQNGPYRATDLHGTYITNAWESNDFVDGNGTHWGEMGRLLTDTNGNAQKIDIPIWNNGQVVLNGSLEQLGSNKAYDIQDTSTGIYYHFINASVNAWVQLNGNNLVWKFDVPSGTGQVGFWQTTNDTSGGVYQFVTNATLTLAGATAIEQR